MDTVKSFGSKVIPVNYSNEILQDTRKIVNTLSSFPTKYSRFILEQAAISGAFDANLSTSNVAEIAKRLALRLDECSEEYERGWKGSFDFAEGYIFSRKVRGVTDVLSSLPQKCFTQT